MHLSNLPKLFALSKLEDFTFGGVEAHTDKLLEVNTCVCEIAPVREFLKNEKSIIVGERGTGKTALFKLISEGKLKFKQENDYEYLIIPIDEKFSYSLIRDRIIPIINSEIDDDTFRYKIIWEIYILYRILVKLNEHSSDLPEQVRIAISNFKKAFGIEKDTSFIQQLVNFKYTSGVKIDSNSSNPNFYISVEPKEKGDSSIGNYQNICLDIDIYKKAVQEFLEKSNLNVIVLTDKLDEFHVKDEYKVQKIFLQALLDIERDYLSYKNIKLKIFLRKDLFEKLDFSDLGYDKVIRRTIELRWTDSDLRLLIARRIAYNFKTLLNVKRFYIHGMDEELLLDELSIDAYSPSSHVQLLNIAKKMLLKLPFFKKRDRSREARRSDYNDAIARLFITSIFPRRVQHLNGNSKKVQLDVFTFFSTHFCYNNSYTTPRTLLSFLEELLSDLKQYYLKNPDIRKIELDNNHEYPLIKTGLINECYSKFQKQMWEIFSQHCPPNWREWIGLFREERGNKYSFTYAQIKNILQPEDEKDYQQFLAFLFHLGMLDCVNKNARIDCRQYHLPILFRNCLV